MSAITDYIKELEKIPKEIKSDIIVKEIQEKIEENIKKELRRRVSYGKG